MKNELPKPKFCPGCGKALDPKEGLNHKWREKTYKAKCRCGAAWRITPLPWYKACFT